MRNIYLLFWQKNFLFACLLADCCLKVVLPACLIWFLRVLRHIVFSKKWKSFEMCVSLFCIKGRRFLFMEV